jgi:predicted O-methyltransferase YrrM
MKPRHLITRPLRGLLRLAGFDVVPRTVVDGQSEFPADFSGQDADDFRFVRPYTMVPPERIYTLTRAVEYIVGHAVPGAFVECGTWKGGASMAMARSLKRLGVTDRDLYLFDLFADNWPLPTERDVHNGQKALDLVNAGYQVPTEMLYTLDDVKRNMGLAGYAEARTHYVMGSVMDTVPDRSPEQIALLRLDTDFYESTLHELVHLYPRLVSGGVIIIDDYGDWEGSRAATDEYLAKHNIPLCLIRVDVGARMAVKP